MPKPLPIQKQDYPLLLSYCPDLRLMDPKERAVKENAIAAAKQDAWVWRTDQPMPPLKSAEVSR